MNVLADSSTNGAGGGANAIDLSPKDLDTSVFYNWIDKVREIVVKGLEKIKENVVKVLNELKFPKIITETWVIAFNFIESLISNAITFVKGALEFILGFLTGDAEKVKQGFNEMLKAITNSLISFGEVPRKFAKELGNEIIGIYKGVINQIISMFNNMISPLKQVVKGIKQMLEGDLKNGTINIVKGIANGIIGILNKLISRLNAMVSPIRGMIVAVGKALGKNYTMSNIKIPSITPLATGGIVNRPTYAMIGEAGREAVLPLDRNTEWMNELAKKINSNGGVVNVYLDGRLIQRQYNQRQEEFNFATNGGM